MSLGAFLRERILKAYGIGSVQQGQSRFGELLAGADQIGTALFGLIRSRFALMVGKLSVSCKFVLHVGKDSKLVFASVVALNVFAM